MASRDELREDFINHINSATPLPLTGQEPLDSSSEAILHEMAERMKNNYPYAHPLYAGQMLKPPHAIAREAYAFAQNINPNNHALDGGKESSSMEMEAVAGIAKMFGWNEHLGHLTGGGTMANLEALWIASQIHPNKRILASTAAHYTHERITAVLGIPFSKVENATSKPVMDLTSLEAELQKGDVGTVVLTAGTTGTGHVEPIAKGIELCKKYEVRTHIDAAYGGYFSLVMSGSELEKDFAAISKADSIVIDPHKHGLQPYGCGCVLFADPSIGKYYLHDSPYTYFTSDQLHLGEISLECSRPGASAVALWTTMKRFPLVKDGEMATGLNNCLSAAKSLHSLLLEDGSWILPYKPDLDILVFAPNKSSSSQITEASQKVFDKAEEKGLYLALYKMSAESLQAVCPDIEIDSSTVTLLRSTLMKWNHHEYVRDIYKILVEVA